MSEMAIFRQLRLNPRLQSTRDACAKAVSVQWYSHFSWRWFWPLHTTSHTATWRGGFECPAETCLLMESGADTCILNSAHSAVNPAVAGSLLCRLCPWGVQFARAAAGAAALAKLSMAVNDERSRASLEKSVINSRFFYSTRSDGSSPRVAKRWIDAITLGCLFSPLSHGWPRCSRALNFLAAGRSSFRNWSGKLPEKEKKSQLWPDESSRNAAGQNTPSKGVKTLAATQ